MLAKGKGNPRSVLDKEMSMGGEKGLELQLTKRKKIYIEKRQGEAQRLV